MKCNTYMCIQSCSNNYLKSEDCKAATKVLEYRCLIQGRWNAHALLTINLGATIQRRLPVYLPTKTTLAILRLIKYPLILAL